MLPTPIISIEWPIEIKIYMYGLMIAVGLLFCFLVLFWYAKKQRIDEGFVDFMFYNAIAAIALGFGSGMLFQATYNYIDNPAAGFRFGQGMTFIGGLIGGVVVFLVGYFLFRRFYTARLYQAISIVPCCILIAHAFGRIGCFFAGCCYGKPTDSFLGVQFPGLAHPVHPTQLYEAAFLFIMFGVCSYLLLKKNYQHNLSLYLVSYGIFRFIIEYVRGDERGELVSFISPSQFWAVLMVGAGVAVYFYMRRLLEKDAPAAALAVALAAVSAEETADAAEETADVAEETADAAEETVLAAETPISDGDDPLLHE